VMTMTIPIEIFKPGRHITSMGVAIDFSAAQLEASAKAYDPALHEAPIVLGHPEEDSPAYGWIKSVTFANDVMQADADQLAPSFVESVRRGRYKKVSASFYPPNSARNPKPGVYYLRHVGFLGAASPAVKGLRQAAFADACNDAIVVEFSDLPEHVSFSEVTRNIDPVAVARAAVAYRERQRDRGVFVSTSDACRHVRGIV
jgi:hypothetical protein